eukprot:11039765-Alexandrium_andersonii.AAC.1
MEAPPHRATTSEDVTPSSSIPRPWQREMVAGEGLAPDACICLSSQGGGCQGGASGFRACCL